ncbi:MAG: sulfur carrier protein ThiS [Verrucomicrobia bacterium]|nr:sulfur carrier protein ThiS [Deltaproteobacteria bacterium]
MRVIVNGESTEARDGGSVAELLSQLQIQRDRVAVEVNLEIVPKSHYDSHTLADGDRIEIVQFVGGG